jgi:hypothetical protein
MRLLPLFAFCLLAITACERVEERMPITQTRQISPLARPAQASIPSATRFYDDTVAAEEEEGEKQNPLAWVTPAGWSEQKTSQMRLINLSFGPNAEGECYLTAIPGDAGGIAANLNRWRGQMSQPNLTDAEITALPKKPLMGAEAMFLTVDGDFKGMGDAANAQKDQRLVGLLMPNPELTIFIKMTGPKALVEQNMAAFDAFCQSVQFRGKAQPVPSH